MVGAHVVYLVWPPLGPVPLERFAASYRGHSAGIDHRLVIVVKGPADDRVGARCCELAEELNGDLLDVEAVGRDLDTYAVVARRLDATDLCLLNTSSEVLAEGWLRALHGGLHEPGVGVVGATGTYESALSSAPRPLRPLLRRRYPAFPNPHIRTNGFMLSQDLMLDLDWPHGGGKRAALELESGIHSITRQVLARGLRAVVVDRHARIHEPEQWPESLTFRSEHQQNLLIADNRTRQYDRADPARRAELARYAWGDHVSLSPAPRASARSG